MTPVFRNMLLGTVALLGLGALGVAAAVSHAEEPSGADALRSHLAGFNQAQVVLSHADARMPRGVSHWLLRADGTTNRFVLDQMEGAQYHLYFDGQTMWETRFSDRTPRRREGYESTASALWAELRSGLSHTTLSEHSPGESGHVVEKRFGQWFLVGLPPTLLGPLTGNPPPPGGENPPLPPPPGGSPPPPAGGLYIAVRPSGEPAAMLMIKPNKRREWTVSDLDWAASFPAEVFSAAFPEVRPTRSRPRNHPL